jgi:hypothetical protein
MRTEYRVRVRVLAGKQSGEIDARNGRQARR